MAEYDDIKQRLIQESYDITAAPEADSLSGVTSIPVVRTSGGTTTIVRVPITLLTADAQAAVISAGNAADTATTAAQRAEDALSAATSATATANAAAASMEDAVAELRQQIADYFDDADTSTKRRLTELAEMVDSAEITATLDSMQLYEDYKEVTGFTGTYYEFLALIGSGGGGSVNVDSAISGTSTNPVQNKVIKQALDGKQDIIEYLTVLDINQILLT